MKEEREEKSARWRRKSERGRRVSGQTGEHDEQRRTWSPHRVHSGLYLEEVCVLGEVRMLFSWLRPAFVSWSCS